MHLKVYHQQNGSHFQAWVYKATIDIFCLAKPTINFNDDLTCVNCLGKTDHICLAVCGHMDTLITFKTSFPKITHWSSPQNMDRLSNYETVLQVSNDTLVANREIEKLSDKIYNAGQIYIFDFVYKQLRKQNQALGKHIDLNVIYILIH